jgi:Peptidase family M28
MITRCHEIMVAILLVLCAGLSIAQTPVNQSGRKDNSPLNLITPEMVKPLVVQLSADEFGGRGAGYAGERKAAELIAKEFKRIGLLPAGDLVDGRRTYFQQFKFHPHHPIIPWELLTSRNVIGLIEGEDAVLKQEIVVIGAHYDGQGRVGEADPFRFPPLAPEDKDARIWPSANDNLTGVSAVLAAARTIKQGRINTKRSILFIAFGCEEHGQSGSIAYVSHPAFELSRHVAMINYDKLGRSPDKPLIAGSTGSSTNWNEVLEQASSTTGTQVKRPVPFVIPDSDHYPFAATGVPAVMFSVSGPDEAHRPSDVADKIDYNRVAEYARYGLAVLLDLANRPTRLVYVDVLGFNPGMIAHLAADQEADAVGLKAPETGLKVTGLIPGSAADKAGVRVGDLMVKAGEFSFRRDVSLQTLQKIHMQLIQGQLGMELPVTLLRSGKQVQLVIDLRRK